MDVPSSRSVRSFEAIGYACKLAQEEMAVAIFRFHYDLSLLADVAVLFVHNDARQEAMIRLQRRTQKMHEQAEIAEPYQPLWQVMSKLGTEQERWMSPNERARRIVRLLRKVEGLVRFEIQNAK